MRDIEPKIRFKEFYDKYNEYKLKDIVDFYRGNTLSKADITLNGTKKCILYGELYTKYSEIAYNIYSKTNNSNENLIFGKINDVLIPCSGETALDISTSTCLQVNDVIIGGDLNILRPKKDDGKYLSYLLCHKKRREIAKYAQGDSIVHLYGEKIKNIIIKLPSIKEQEKVSNLLSLLDKKIELQKQKIENLKLYKKGLIHNIFKLSKLYSKNYKIKNCIELYDNKTTQNNQYTILSSTKNGIKIQDDYFNRQTASENNIGYKIVPKGYITYRSMSDTGDFYFNIQNIVDIGIVSPAYPVFKTTNIVNKKYFIAYLNNAEAFRNQLLITKEGGTRFALSISKLSELEINLPEIHLQNYYANLIEICDKKYDYHQLKLENLIKYKKSLLQQMFI